MSSQGGASGNEQSSPPLSNCFAEIVSSLIRNLIRVPGFPNEHANKLYKCLLKLAAISTPEELTGLGKEMEELCASAVAEIDTSSGLSEHKDELSRIAATLAQSTQSMFEASASSDSNMAEQLQDLNQTIAEDRDPFELSRKIESIADRIKKNVGILKEELSESRTKVEEAGGKIQNLEKELHVTREESIKDGLTGLHNRRAFNHFIKSALSSYDQEKLWCLIMIDIDHFKRVNDTHGHIIGDALLFKLAHILSGASRDSDFVGRYGGEEFVIMLPSTPLPQGMKFCEVLQGRIRNSRWQYRSTDKEIVVSATVSAGVALQRQFDTPETLIARADSALYLAKESGRNCVRSESDVS